MEQKLIIEKNLDKKKDTEVSVCNQPERMT